MATEPRLKHDDTNCQKVSRAPPEVVCPKPATPVANQHYRQPENNKNDDCKVQKKDGICKGMKGHGEFFCDG